MAKSRIQLISNVTVLVFERAAFGRLTELSRGLEVYSVVASEKHALAIVDEDSAGALKKAGGLVKERTHLCMLRITSPPVIEDAPGVAAMIMNAFAERGINITDMYSCYTDTNIVVGRQSALDAFTAIESLKA